MARKFDLSIALFAHGWTCEKADNWDQFVDNESRLAFLFFSFTRCSFFSLCFFEFSLLSLLNKVAFLSLPESVHLHYME